MESRPGCCSQWTSQPRSGWERSWESGGLQGDFRDATRASVVGIHNKGRPQGPESYRLRSLLTGMYKMCAALLDKRVNGRVGRASSAQHAAWRSRCSLSTGSSIMRGTVGQRTKQCSWIAPKQSIGSGMDGYVRSKSVHAARTARQSAGQNTKMECTPPELVFVVMSIWIGPDFCIDLNKAASSWALQERSIWQGCPLSLYLLFGADVIDVA